jgi:hypothetical protein
MWFSGAAFQRVGPHDCFGVHSWLWRSQAQLQHSNQRLKRELGDWKVKFTQLSSLNNLFLLHRADKFSNTQKSDSVNDTHTHCKQEESPVSNHTQGHRLLYGSIIPGAQLVSPSAKSMYVSAEIRYNSWRKFLQIMTWANNLKTGDLKAKLPLDLNLEDWFPQEIMRS